MGRCIQCGQVNDKRKTSWSKRGEGREGESGCRFCASLYWQTEKPQKIADDRFKANPDLKRR